MDSEKLEAEIVKVSTTPLEELKIRQVNELINTLEKLRLTMHG